jgi:hypothetical protein
MNPGVDPGANARMDPDWLSRSRGLARHSFDDIGRGNDMRSTEEDGHRSTVALG